MIGDVGRCANMGGDEVTNGWSGEDRREEEK
jgi:hypothetical protein